VRLHDLRRTLGSWQTMTGASSTVVGKILGHKSQASTVVYARMNLDPVRDSIKTAVEAMLATRELPEKIVKIGGDK
jgi:integrase